MKLNISYPSHGTQKTIEIDNELKMRPFYEKRISHEVPGDSLGDEFKGYIFRITGGNDRQGFPMKQGVLTNKRVRLLFSKGQSCYRSRRAGERKRKSVRGCIVDSQLSVLSLVIVKKGEQDIPGITDTTRPRRLGPKRANKLRTLFALDKTDDVRKYVIKRKIEKEGKKATVKAPKIQRLVTPQRVQRKRAEVAGKRNRAVKQRELAADYAVLLAKRAKERTEARKAEHERRRLSSNRASGSSDK